MATVYTVADVDKRRDQYKAEGGVLRRTANALIFNALSTNAKFSGHFYRVSVVPGTGDTWAADCTCEAGQNGRQCKHGAAAISAVRLQTLEKERQTLSDAARIMARRSAEVRKARRGAA
jgi:uncharacterized Zn finger protein